MTESQTLNKVTAFVTRNASQVASPSLGIADQKELLVFRHPTAGVQLPAGTVEDGEDPRVAVIREVIEETGLTGVEIVRELAVEETVVPTHQRAVLRETTVLSEPRSGSRTIAVIGRSGFWLDVGDLNGDYRHVTHVEYEFDGEIFIPTRSMAGWVLDDALATRVIRRHYEVRTTASALDRWTHFAEGEFDWEFYWTPLREDAELVASNRAWLLLVIEALCSKSNAGAG